MSAKDWRPLIKEVHDKEPWAEFDMLPWIEAQMHVESRGRADAVSTAGARGLMQIMPATALGEFGVSGDALDDPKTNVEMGVRYMRRLFDSFESRVPDARERLLWAFAAYNGGGSYARKALKLCRDDSSQLDDGSHPAHWKWDFAKHWYLHRDCCITTAPGRVLRPRYIEVWNYLARIRKYHAQVKQEAP